jgi:hypothetical protein
MSDEKPILYRPANGTPADEVLSVEQSLAGPEKRKVVILPYQSSIGAVLRRLVPGTQRSK